jgi:type IV secretion system protein VirB10
VNTPQYPEDDRSEIEREQNASRDGREPLGGNPYANQNRRAAEPDLDATAPQLRATELRRMNRRALLLLGAVVLLLLFVAYWMVTSAGSRKEAPKLRDEKVTVADAPNTLRMPQLPPAPPATPPVAAIPVVPQAPPLAPANSPQPISRGPTLLDRRIAASAEGGNESGTAVPQATPTGQPSQLPTGEQSGPTSAQPLTHPNTLMQRGTYIRCVLETRIVSDVPGFTTCLVTEPVYSFNGHTLLLPKGSKMLGAYSSKPRFKRMEVIWDRIITPTGIDVDMKSPGIDNLGGAGLPGYYDAHWAQRISSALFISLLSDAFKYEAAVHGPKSNAIAGSGVVVQEPYESNTAQTMQNFANQAVQESANRLPTVTINQGTIIYVYVARDVDFSGVVARF